MAAELSDNERPENGDDSQRTLTPLPELSSRAFEHPADRAALAALRRVPGFDLVLRKLIGFIGERGLRFVFLASAVRVTDSQFSRVNRLYEECLEVLDLKERPELFVAQTPFVNAGAVGVDRPFIVINSATLELMRDDELRFILGHELGHILCDHVLYKTMLALLLRLSITRLGIPLGGLALFAIIAALSEWDRKSELSCDRAGLLCLQDPWKAYTVFMKMAGGAAVNQMDITEFVRQAQEYEEGGDELDGVFKLVNLVGRRHPFNVLRLAELKKWVERGDYERILSGTYDRRDDGEQPSVYQELADSARTYRESVNQSKDPLFQFFRDLGSQVGETGSNLWGQLRGAFSRKTEDAGSPGDESGDETQTGGE